MHEVYVHEITRDFLAHLKIKGQHLNESLSITLESDLYVLHLEFLENGATLGCIVRDLAKSELVPLYTKIIERINTTEHTFINIGVSIFNEHNIAINTFIPDTLLDVYGLINFYEYANNELLLSL